MKYFWRVPLLAAALAVLLSIAQAQGSYENWSAYKDLAFATSLQPVRILQNPAGGYYVASTNDQSMCVASYDASGTLLWSKGFAGIASDLGVCSTGVYLVGATNRSQTNVWDTTVVFFDTTGARQWFHYSPGTSFPGSGPDVHVAVDGSGNAIVTGSRDNAGLHDIYVEKLNALGLVAWEHTFGQALNDEVAHGIAVDTAGNAFIAGTTGTGSASDALTLKYGSDGSLVWSQTFNAPGNDADNGYRVTTDGDGSAYVAVSGAFDSNNLSNITGAVVKYSSAGVQSWLSDAQASPMPECIRISPIGNIVVLGNDGQGNSGFAQFNSSGQYQNANSIRMGTFWTTHSYDLAFDNSGNIYAGGEDENLQAATDKFDTGGQLVWQKTYVGQPGFNDTISVVENPNGGVTVAGVTTRPVTDTDVTLQFYNTDGTLSQPSVVNDYGGSMDDVEASVTDLNGYTYVVGGGGAGSGNDSAIFKGAIVRFTPSGGVSWSRSFGSAGVSSADAVALTPAGNIAVAGIIYNQNLDLDDEVVRLYDSAGNLLWSTVLGHNPDPRRIVSDASGNLYVSDGGDQDTETYTVSKVSSTGTLVWRASRPNPTNDEDLVNFALTVDSSGNAYIGGETITSTNTDGAVVRFNSNGTFAWMKFLNGPNSGYVNDLQIDSLGQVSAIGGINSDTDHAVAYRFSAAGDLLWNTSLDVDGYDATGSYQSAFDSDGNLYVVGVAANGSDTDIATFKVDSDGFLDWAHTYGEPGVREKGTKILVDSDDNVYAAGIAWSAATARNYVVVKYSPTGEMPWPTSGDVFVKGGAQFDNPEHTQDLLRSVGIDGNDGIYLAGSSYGPNGSVDFHVTRMQLHDNSVAVAFDAQSQLVAGQTYWVSITMKNTTNFPWTANGGYQLDCLQGGVWGKPFASLAPGETILPGQMKKFGFYIYAPLIAGTYPLQWQMEDSGTLFGQKSSLINCSVGVRQHAARYVSQTVPLTVKAGSTFNVTIKFTNVGTNTWTAAGGYQLASTDPTMNMIWGKKLIPMAPADSIAQGQTKTFTFSVTAPSTPGSYVFRWQMYRSSTAFTGYFGDKTTSKTITVTP